ncbi:MAG: DUF2628 domain-containing protein [Azoarcus sp.]|jgi:hypothetical protein|nr:DUF2628 domain-containing protein [Azoarcus sp.]
MAQFRIFKHPDGRLQAVKIGWCWPAFFFGVIWALISQLWLIAAVTFTIGILTSLVVDGSALFLMYAANISISCVFGYFGNAWREDNLRSRSFEQQEKTVEASGKDKALAIHATADKAVQTAVPQPEPPIEKS